MNKIFHKIICLAFMLMVCGSVWSADIASGKFGNCDWVIDTNGNLIVSPQSTSIAKYNSSLEYGQTEMWSSVTNESQWKEPWVDYRKSIKTARFKAGVKLSTCAFLFHDCSYMTHFYFEDSNSTKDVTSLNSMFWECGGLTKKSVEESDLNFNTDNVTDMTSMFNSCTSLSGVDLSRLTSTSKVTSMSLMFYNCFSLTSFVWPNKTSLSTSNVMSVQQMFYSCKSLITLDLRYFSFTSVDNYSSALSHESQYNSVLSSIYMPDDVAHISTINGFLSTKQDGVTCAIYFPTGSKSDFTNTSVMTALNIGTTNYPYTLGQYVLAGDITDNYTTIDPDYTSGKSTTAWNFAAGEVRYFRKLTNNWGTVVLPYDIDKGNDNDNVSGCTFFYPSKIEDNDLVISRKQIEPEANKPCILHNSSASVSSPVELQFVNKDAYTAASTSLPTPNDVTATNIKLKGVYTDGSLLTVKTASDNSQAYYYYQADAFWHATARLRVASFHSYIYDATATSSSAKSLNIVFDDEDDASGIEEIETGVENAAAYNLAGQRLAAPAKGQINIIKGKKVMVK